MENILVHIGFHKTGTTWLQNELFVPWNDVFEPLSLDDTKQSSLAKHFYLDSEENLLSSFDLNEEIIKQEVNKISQMPNRDFSSKIPVMSRERLSGHPSCGGIDSKIIADRIKHAFPKAKILIVVRNQKEIILSNYFQYLQEGGTFNIKKFLTTKYDGFRPYFTLNYLKYDLITERYFDLFGKSNVLVMPYELFKDEPEIFFNKLGSFLDRQITIPEQTLNKVVNRKSSLYAKYHLRFLNYFIVKNSYNNYSVLSNRVTRSIAKLIILMVAALLPKRLDTILKKKFKKTIEDTVTDYFSVSNQNLSSLLDQDLQKYGYQ